MQKDRRTTHTQTQTQTQTQTHRQTDRQTHTHTHTKPKLINRVGSANEEEELKTKNQRNKQTRGGDILWGIRVDAP